MKKIIAAVIIGISSLFTTSIYTNHYTALNGNEISLSQYQNKKMLLVNMRIVLVLPMRPYLLHSPNKENCHVLHPKPMSIALFRILTVRSPI